MIYLYLAAGGAAGTIARFWMTGWVGGHAGTGFPFGTLAVNLVGSLVLGAAIGMAESSAISPELRGLVTVGLCGAFTTFSTMSYETLLMMQDGAWGRAAAYAFGGLALGILAVVIGLSAARAMSA